MDRRDALRTAAAIAAGSVVAGCGTNSGTPSWKPGGTTPSTPSSPEPNASTSTPSVLPAQITHGPRDRPQVALTFHGQGDAGVVGRLLDQLEKGGVHVTVMAVGTWLAASPDLARRVAAAGHELGNHTQHHADIKRMSAAGAYAEINDCAQALHGLTGSIGRWFRPSQTQYATPTIEAAAAKAGYRTCLSYDVDSLDYTDPGAAAVVANTLRTVRSGSIVSMHFGHEGTVAAISPLLRGLRQRGLTPVTMTELMK